MVVLGLLTTLIALAPQPGNESREAGTSEVDAHQGISFNNWLDLFLDYAIGLAIAHRRDEAYQVCEAARDSTAFQAPEHGFIIYVAWSGTLTTNSVATVTNSTSLRNLYKRRGEVYRNSSPVDA